MDPYLEDPTLWPSVHQRLITYVGDTLTELLPPRYVANITERLSIDEPDRDIYPDAAVLERQPAVPPPARNGGAGTALACDAPWRIEVVAEEVREPFIEIVPVADAERVVTVIEVLSPTNKAAGTRGRRLYRDKQRQVLASSTHLLEFDLLRHGEHTVAVPHERVLRRGHYDYLVSLSRGHARQVCDVWAATVRQRLPRVAVPLLEDDPDITLDLEALFTLVYDRGGYARRLNYRREPLPPLTPEDAAWADVLLRERGLRPNPDGATS
jgi:hypothetical protein